MFSFPVSSVVLGNVKFLLILQWISDELQANVLTFSGQLMFSGKKMKEGTERWFTEEEERPCKKNGIMFQLDGPARKKEWLEVGEQAFATLQLLPCLYRQAEEDSLWEKAPHIASSSPQCSAQVFWFMRPDQLSQPCHVLPSWFLSVKKWTHCVAHIHIQLWFSSVLRRVCGTTAYNWCPLEGLLLADTIEISQETALGILGIFWAL